MIREATKSEPARARGGGEPRETRERGTGFADRERPVGRVLTKGPIEICEEGTDSRGSNPGKEN